ncbi:SPOR domain-containing protein [Draconibacterium sp. IB214405]|uniref:SPOR domain-containing protein n=1 Tax=Draconibacterium sp. IB214405 TaxID=3097352 RepID=UPI002A12D15D|nr:SPOR domain-containing protein [Draconibacterium sp. IB214405]MDX8337944.1 SPOR domain-containing protein [Draconibacterium sp. IB214405]
MKRIVILLVVVATVASSCKIFKQPAQAESEYTTDTTAPTKVFTVPGTETTDAQPTAVTKSEPVADVKPIAVRKEQVSFTNQTDQTANAGNTFFVILGSFGQLDNAKNYRTTLIDEGFTPIILHSETGYYRVCVNSYKSESEARGRVAQVRNAFPKYSDVWLLIKE